MCVCEGGNEASLFPISGFAYTYTYMCFISADNLWMSIHKTKQGGADQPLFNNALHHLGVRWNRISAVKDICKIQSGWQSNGPLNCYVFSQKDVCRGCCRRAHEHNYYVLHPLTKKIARMKPNGLKYMGGWFLSDSWRKRKKSVGETWLRSISTFH